MAKRGRGLCVKKYLSGETWDAKKRRRISSFRDGCDEQWQKTARDLCGCGCSGMWLPSNPEAR